MTNRDRPVTQDWVHTLSFMQQTVLLSAIRGCDGIAKFHKAKLLVRWYRRCLVLNAMNGKVLTTPSEPGGGSFTGQSVMDEGDSPYKQMQRVINDFMDSRDDLPMHYFTHFMHAVQIMGYKHPDMNIRSFWNRVYVRMVNTLHLFPETEAQMDRRLGDDEVGWREREDPSAHCSD